MTSKNKATQRETTRRSVAKPKTTPLPGSVSLAAPVPGVP
jgi:hypothetical protein